MFCAVGASSPRPATTAATTTAATATTAITGVVRLCNATRYFLPVPPPSPRALAPGGSRVEAECVNAKRLMIPRQKKPDDQRQRGRETGAKNALIHPIDEELQINVMKVKKNIHIWKPKKDW